MFIIIAYFLSLTSVAYAYEWPSLMDAKNAKIDKMPTFDQAMIVSIENYDDVGVIPGAQKNAEAWYNWLNKGLGMRPNKVHLLTNKNATREEMLALAEKVGKRSKSGERILFLFIGHGAAAKNGKEGLLLGADVRQTANSIYARSVSQSELIAKLESNNAQVLAIIDSCFSGKTGTNTMVAKGLQPLIVYKAVKKATATVLSAGTSNQFAGPLPGADRPAFSYLLLGALRGWGNSDGDKEVSVQEALDYSNMVLQSLESVLGRPQTPQGAGSLLSLRVAKAVEKSPDISQIRLSLDRTSSSESKAEKKAKASSSTSNRSVGEVKQQDGYAEVLIPQGTFTMGCENEKFVACEDVEKPAHRVTIGKGMYWMVSEVKQNFYEKITGENPSRFQQCGGRCPVESISWIQAAEFANALSEKEGRNACYTVTKARFGFGKTKVVWDNPHCDGWRLPTEAEWEYAAKSNLSLRFAGADKAKEVAWFAKNSKGKTHRVCNKTPNRFGLCDMSGNVREWVWDSWLRKYDEDQKDPAFVKKDTDWKVLRGGSWGSYEENLSCSNRYGASSAEQSAKIGFRLVRAAN